MKRPKRCPPPTWRTVFPCVEATLKFQVAVRVSANKENDNKKISRL